VETFLKILMGERSPVAKIAQNVRFTPTGVGTTPGLRPAVVEREVHPHGRGDDGWRVLRFSGQMIERDPWGCRDLVAAAILHFLHTNDGGGA
jgi:hypothetical protein